MKTASVREFKSKATAYLAAEEEVLVTRRGRPVAVVTPVKERTTAALLLGLRRVLSEAGVSKADALAMLKRARRDVYG